MRTLFLYADDNGMARAAIVSYTENEPADEGFIGAVKEQAQDFNPGCTFFFVELPEVEGVGGHPWRPDITTDYGDEVPVQFIELP